MKPSPAFSSTPLIPRLRIAMLDDDDLLREQVLLPGLADFGFEVTGAARAGELYRLMLGRQFDIVVADIGLPDESGLSVVRHLRDLFPTLGIVMLTANRGRNDHLRALTEGADAYLLKPADLDMLALTLRRLAQRLPSMSSSMSAAPAPAVSTSWRLASDGWCLLAPGGQMLALNAPERSVLRQLFSSAGRTVTRAVLINELAGDASDFDPHRLEMLVHRLRRKAAALAPEDPPLPLQAARGAGYFMAS